MKKLEGNRRAEHLFCLQQSFELYEACLRKIDVASCEIERMMKALDDTAGVEQKPLPPDARRCCRPKRKPLSMRTEPFDMRSVVYAKYGVDVTQIPGIDQNAVLLLSEVGRDMGRWKDHSHFVAWLALCPDNDISRGQSAVERKHKTKDSRRTDVSHGRAIPISQLLRNGRLLQANASETGTAGRDYGYGAQKRPEQET